MKPTQSFSDRLASNAPVCLDGAINIELSKRGFAFDTNDWLMVNLKAPETLAELHGDYARAGAEVHIANSFAAARHALEPVSLVDHFEALNRAAVSLCRTAIDQAAEHEQWIAGSLSTFADKHDRRNLPTIDVLEKNFADQAEILADEGCDLIALEMLFDAPCSIAMLKGAAVTGLPISLGLVIGRDTDGSFFVEGNREGRRGMENTPLTETLGEILENVPPGIELIVSIMHSEISDTGPALDAVRSQWDGALAVYPNLGRMVPPGRWDTDNTSTPVEFAEACFGWVEQGASIVGGCCGVGPAHIQALSDRLREM